MQNYDEKINKLLSECKKLMNTHPQQAEEKAKEALNLSLQSDDEDGRYESLFNLSSLRYANNQNERAITTFDECLKIAEKRKDLRRIAQSKNALGVIYNQMAINSKALDYYLEALEIVTKHTINDLRCKVHNNIAAVFSDLKDYEKSLGYLKSAYHMALSINEPVMVYLRNMAGCYFDLKQYDKAYEYCIMARNANWKLKDESVRADIYFILGAVLHKRGKKQRAMRAYRFGLTLAERFHCYYSQTEGLIDLAEIYMSENQFGPALKSLDKAKRISELYQYTDLYHRVFKFFVEISQKTGDKDREINALREYWSISEKLEEGEYEKKRAYAAMQLTLFSIRKENQHLKENVDLDPLTGCLCYRDFEVKIKDALEESEQMGALLFLDVDNLKTVNDKYGHHAGDKLIIEFANAIKKVFQNSAIKVRKGGDEFVVFLPRASRNYIIQVIEELFAFLARPRVIGKTLMPLSCSIGIALAPQDSTSVKELEAMADKAMYQAKKMGKRCYSFYDSLTEYGTIG